MVRTNAKGKSDLVQEVLTDNRISFAKWWKLGAKSSATT